MYGFNKTNYDPALCRCCSSLTKFRVINDKYYNLGQEEVYSDMIKDCFGFEMAKLDGKPSDRLICGPCMNKLRDAWTFKNLLQETEQKFRREHKLPPEFNLKLRSSTDLKQKQEISDESSESSIPDGLGSSLRLRPRPEMKKSQSSSDGYSEGSIPDGLGSHLRHGSSSDMKLSQRSYDGYSEGSIPDGLDDELDAEQLEEYYSLGNGIEPHDEDDHSIASTDLSVDTVDSSQYSTEHDVHTKKSDDDISPDDKKHVYNATAIMQYSFACPFKNRFNHLLCYYCSQYFLKPTHLREHTLTHTHYDFKVTGRNRFIKIDITRIDCKLCSEKIDNLDDFKRHLTATHKKHYFLHSKDGVIPFKLVQNVNVCTICGEDFEQFKTLVRHMNQHFSNYVCETCGMGFMDEKSLQKHIPSHDGKRYPCETCGSTLKSEYTLQCHIKRMHGKTESISDLSDVEPPKKKTEEEVACQGCDQIFKSRKYLAIHVRKSHMNYRHVCQVCGQKFFTRFALNNHMPTHTGERNFKCKVCGKSYPRLKTLKEHTRIHTNDRRYSTQTTQEISVIENENDDKFTDIKQKIYDDQSAGCSKMYNVYTRRFYETQSTGSNQSIQTTLEIGDIKIETISDQGTSDSAQIVPIRMDNKAAERSRLYRERRREEINQRRRDIRNSKKKLHQQNVSHIQNIEPKQISRATTNSQSTNSHTQRQQRYYERHKEEINKRKRDSRLKQNILQLIPTTAAERNRNYRERNKHKINERRRHSRRQKNIQRQHTECNKNNIDGIEQLTNTSPSHQQNLNS